MKSLILATFFVFSISSHADDDEGWPTKVKAGAARIASITTQAQNPTNTPQQNVALQEQRKEAVEQLADIATSRPNNTAANLAVSKSLASVEEAPRAIPYAERGLKLAETSGDPKMIRQALLTGSEVYYRAGNYELARERAQRVLKQNPRDKDAMALYMLVKDRGAAAGASPAAAGAGSGGRLVLTNEGGLGSATATALSRPSVAMTSASSLEAERQISQGWSRMKLDAKAALRNFDAAVAADPKSSAARVQRSKARLEAGDAAGALEDADTAIMLDPMRGETYAARAEAKRALGRAEAELLADYETAAKLDGNFTADYKAALLQSGLAATRPDGATGGDGDATAPDGPRNLLTRSPKNWGLYALFFVLLAAAGGIIVPLMLKRRRSGEDDSLPR